jgi:hypothetical protein
MQLSNRDQKILADLGKARSLYPDLKEVLDFYHRLFQTQFAFKSHLASQDQTGYWENREIRLRDLANGIAQIRFEEMEMRPFPFLTLYRDIVKLLIPYTGAPYDPEAEPSPEKLWEYAREIFLSGGPLVAAGEAEDLVRTASGLALAPYLQFAGERIGSRLPPDLWHREFCPVCGGGPSFASLTSASGSRTLFCGRCFAEWPYRRIGCPQCKSDSTQTYHPGDDGRHRLYVCDGCKRYLKTVDIREGGLDLCLPVENLVTLAMDLAAQERGYRTY